MEDIFADIEKAGEIEQEKQTVDLGAITRLVNIQAEYERPVNQDNVARLYETAKHLKVSVNDLEELVKLFNKDLFKVRQVQIPELMKEFGLDSITTRDGITIQIKDGLSVSVRDQTKLFRYLREHDAGDLIKRTIVVTVDDDEAQEEVIALLDNEDCMYDSKEGIHAATLKKYIKDGLEKGERPSDDAVNIYEYRYSAITKKSK